MVVHLVEEQHDPSTDVPCFEGAVSLDGVGSPVGGGDLQGEGTGLDLLTQPGDRRPVASSVAHLDLGGG